MMKRWVIFCLFLMATSSSAQFNLYLESRIPVPTEKVTCAELSKGGRFLAYGCQNGRVFVWDIGAKRSLHELKGHQGAVTSLVFDSQERTLVSGGNGRIVFWDLYSGQQGGTLREFGSQVRSLALSPDDRLLAAGGDSRDVLLWEFPVGSLRGKMRDHKKKVLSVAFNINGDQLLSVGEDRQMIVWNVGTQQVARKTSIEARTMRGSGIDIKSAAYSFDRQFVGVGIEEHILAKGGRSMIFKYNMSFFDWKTGAEIATLQDNRKDIRFFAISPDKRYAVTDNSTLQNDKLSFWNIQAGIVEQNVPMDGEMTAIAMSEDGRWLAVAYEDEERAFQSYVGVWQISGIDGYQRFATGQSVQSRQRSGFGSAMRLTTPEEPLIQFGQRRRIAVLYLDSPGLEEEVARTASYLLEGQLGNSPFVELVERNQIQQVLDELKYQQTGLTTSNAVEVGQHLNAEFILTGSLNKLGNLLIVTAKLVNVETSQIEGTREVQCSNATIENISEMVALLAPTIAKY